MREARCAVSEVREGVITGCFKILENVLELCETNPILTSQKNKNFLFNNLFICYHQVDSARQISHSEDEVGLLNQLLRRFLQESEPPILEANLQLMEEMSSVMSFVNLTDVSTQEAFTDAIPQLLQVVCGTYRPDTLLDFMDPTIRTAYTSTSHLQEEEETEHSNIAPTMSAAYAINLLGWVMGGFFNPAVKVLDALQDKLTLARPVSSSGVVVDPPSPHSSPEQNIMTAEKVMYNFFFKYVNIESNSFQILGSIDEEGKTGDDEQCTPSSSSSSAGVTPLHVPTASSEQVWSWLRLLEMSVGEHSDSARAGEIAGLDARLSAAQTLLSSGALKWAVLQSVLIFKQITVNPLAESLNNGGGGGDFTTRLWLVALRLLQVQAYV